VPCSQQAQKETYTGSDADGLPRIFLHVAFSRDYGLLAAFGCGFLGLLQGFASLEQAF